MLKKKSLWESDEGGAIDRGGRFKTGEMTRAE